MSTPSKLAKFVIKYVKCMFRTKFYIFRSRDKLFTWTAKVN